MVYVFIPARWHGGKQHVINRIVIHGTVSPTMAGGARNVAHDFATTATYKSAHFVVDPHEVIQCVAEDTVAWHDGTNFGSIGVELCDWVDGPPERWFDTPHLNMLLTATQLVSDLVRRYDIPVRRLTPQQIRDGLKGIVGHIDMRDAYPMRTHHYDPGDAFPWTRFLSMIEAPVIKPPPPPMPAPIEKDDSVIILCQPDNHDATTKRYALLSGFNFVPLVSPGEKNAADVAISKGMTYLWIELPMWNELDRRSHVMLGDATQ